MRQATFATGSHVRFLQPLPDHVRLTGVHLAVLPSGVSNHGRGTIIVSAVGGGILIGAVIGIVLGVTLGAVWMLFGLGFGVALGAVIGEAIDSRGGHGRSHPMH